MTFLEGLSLNNVCALARAPGGQMQDAATQAMRCHRRGAATQQVPARRRAPLGCGPQAHWRCCLLLAYYPVWLSPAQFSMLVPSRRAWGSAAKCKRYSLTGPNWTRYGFLIAAVLAVGVLVCVYIQTIRSR